MNQELSLCVAQAIIRDQSDVLLLVLILNHSMLPIAIVKLS